MQQMPTPRELAELSALADGTLDPAHRADIEARVAASPELRELYERERGIVDVLRRASATDRAPERLRARIDARRPRPRTIALKRGGYAGALVGALAAAAVAIVLVLPGGTPGAPSLSQAAALAVKGAKQPAPPPDPSEPNIKLWVNVEDVYFPNWSSTLGWRAVGQRNDDIGGHSAVTIYYRGHGKQIAYTIVSAPLLKQPSASTTTLNGTELRTLMLDNR